MISESFHIFAAAAQAGSFTRAADTLFMSATNVMKQINRLEERLDMTLFIRSPRGLQLTEAGSVLLQSTLDLEKQAQAALAAAQSVQNESVHTLRAGTSILNDARGLMELLRQIWPEQMPFSLSLIPFQDDHEGILTEIDSIGSRYDIIAGICDSSIWLQKIQFLPIKQIRKTISVPLGHPLARQQNLFIADLHKQTLMMVPEGHSEINNEIHAFFRENLPDLNIVDSPEFYDMNVFNLALQENMLLLSNELWKDIHPGFICLEVEDWDFSIPYGLLYSRYPGPAVRLLVDQIHRSGILKP